MITTNHKVLNEGGESRNNHRYATVVQDLAIQRIQSYPCKTKTSQRQKGVYESFSSRRKSHKSFTPSFFQEFGTSCEELSWNHRTSTPHRSETNGISERAVRTIREGTSAVLLQSGFDEKWLADFMECYCYLRHVQDLCANGKHRIKGDNHSKV